MNGKRIESLKSIVDSHSSCHPGSPSKRTGNFLNGVIDLYDWEKRFDLDGAQYLDWVYYDESRNILLVDRPAITEENWIEYFESSNCLSFFSRSSDDQEITSKNDNLSEMTIIKPGAEGAEPEERWQLLAAILPITSLTDNRSTSTEDRLQAGWQSHSAASAPLRESSCFSNDYEDDYDYGRYSGQTPGPRSDYENDYDYDRRLRSVTAIPRQIDETASSRP